MRLSVLLWPALVCACTPLACTCRPGPADGCAATRPGDGNGRPGGAAAGPVVVVFADEPFYRERPEPEAVFEGTLRRVEAPIAPGGRSLPFQLDGLPVYPGGEDTLERLEPFTGRRVRIVGKRVDLSAEGFGVELWPGTIRMRDGG